MAGKDKKGGSANKKILLVEDDHTQIMMYQTEMASHGYKVFAARNKDEAMEMVSEKEPDLVFMDLLLGRENGMDVIKEFKKRGYSVPIVILTNYKKEEIKKEAEKIGVLDYLIKSQYIPRELAEKIENYIK